MSNALNRKTIKTPAGGTAGIFTEILSRLAAVYVLLMAGVFPLFTTDMYYNILQDKYYFFFYLTAATVAIALIVLLTGILGGAFRRQKDGTSPLKELFRPTVTDLFFLAFILAATVSTLASEWVYEAFWGNNGRLQGLAFFLAAFLGWIIVTRFYRFRRWHLYVLLTAGLLVCLWGISDFLALDLFGWREVIDYLVRHSFTSSIGNIDTFTAVAALYAGVFAGLALCKKTNAFFWIGFFVAVLAMITGVADNAVLALGGLFGLLPFYVFRKRERIGKYLFLTALVCGAMALTGFVLPVWTWTEIQSDYSYGALLKLSAAFPRQLAAAAAVFAAAGTVLQLTAKKDTRYRAKPFVILWGVVCLLGLALLVWVFADVNTEARLPVPESLVKYFLFDEKWGSGRGYIWKKAFELFDGFGPFRKLFGSGPETYGILMERNYYAEMVRTKGVLFDSPHSEPLQYLFTTGILGFTAFYGTMVSGITAGVRKGGLPAAFAFGCVPFLFASIINISAPISTPLLLLMLALAVSVKEHEEEV